MAIDIENTINQLKALPEDERIKVVEAVWDSIGEATPSVAVNPEQRAELDRRLDAYEADPKNLLSWDQVLEQLRGRL